MTIEYLGIFCSALAGGCGAWMAIKSDLVELKTRMKRVERDIEKLENQE